MRRIQATALFLALAGTASASELQPPPGYVAPMIPSENVIAAPIGTINPIESAAVVFSNLDTGPNGYVAFPPATDAVGFEDYSSISVSAIDVTTFRFVGGVQDAGGIIQFEFFSTGGAFIGSFAVALTNPGNFVYTINVPAGTVLADSSGIVQCRIDAATTGQWFLGDQDPLAVGAQDPTNGNAAPDFWHNFELSGFPQSSGAYCYGDGLEQDCPCSNLGGPGEGCANSSGLGGKLTGTGVADTAADSFVLTATSLPAGVTCVFFDGPGTTSALGAGLPFNDGLRCVGGGGIVRLETTSANPGGTAFTTVSLSAASGVSSGEFRSYQCWYRDNSGPCGLGSNTTNAWLQEWL